MAQASGLFVTVSGMIITGGVGAPVNIAPQGSLYLRTDGSSISTRLYVNTTGAAIWTAVSTIT